MAGKKRTDLAVEAHELCRESAEKTSQLQGVAARSYHSGSCRVTRVEVLNQQGAEALGKPVGHYITLEVQPLLHGDEQLFFESAGALSRELRSLLPEGDGPVLVAGVGNRSMTPDAVGPLALQSVLVTRHLLRQLHLEGFRPVSAVAPGVLGVTGLETQEFLRGIVGQTRPSLLIVIDALAARNMRRVCATVQLSDTGITPGSGVGNHRAALTRETLGLPVFSVGVPTVVDAATLISDALERQGTADVPQLQEEENFFVTPQDIDAQVAALARVVGYGISLALQPQLSPQELTALLA